jgi:hypothetical protein
MNDDDPLLAALAALPSPSLPPARAEHIRLHVREMVEPEAPPLAPRAVRALLPMALAAWAVVYLGWTVQRIVEKPDSGTNGQRS